MNWITVGSLTVPIAQLALGLAFAIAACYLWLTKKQALLDVYGNAVLLFILVWKLSVLVFSFELIVQAPLSLLYFNGGKQGFWLAMAAVFLYLAWKGPTVPWKQTIKLWMAVMVLYEILVPLIYGHVGWEVWVRLAGGAFFIGWRALSFLQALSLFTLWQLLFESLTDGLFSTNGWVYIAVAIFFGMIRRRRQIE
ncbi:hypothetical protein [Bacillus xiapuensis]|uniref:hypothetical protein n=1 Tax=Bacillus xiapuensis TaxID=2014075 RepID=UPI000C24FD8E|nr:hypothetical protein [Bacillus xiapuensis]